MFANTEKIKRYYKDTASKVNISILRYFDEIKISDDNKFLAEDILGTYKEYLFLINKLEKYKKPFIEVLKEKDIVRNQGYEGVNPTFVDVYLKSNAPSATEQLIKDKKNGTIYTKDDFVLSHGRMLLGAYSSKEVLSGLRKENNTYVTKKVDNHLVTDYYPVDYKEIETAIQYILKIYNDNAIINEYDVMIRPILIHGLIAALQMFKDGNTRLARVYENIMVWNLSNNVCEFEDNPTIYMSEAIYKYADRSEYRKLISDIAITPNIQTLNKWIEYNLVLIESQIYLNRDKISDILPNISKILK